MSDGVSVAFGDEVGARRIVVRLDDRVALSVQLPEALAPDELAELLRAYVTSRADVLRRAQESPSPGTARPRTLQLIG